MKKKSMLSTNKNLSREIRNHRIEIGTKKEILDPKNTISESKKKKNLQMNLTAKKDKAKEASVT